MKIKWKHLAVCVAIPLAVGGLSAFLTKDAMESFSQLDQPPLSPPMWVFPVVWTVLYVLMGIGAYLVLNSQGRRGVGKGKALCVYALQLAFNFLWTIFFFNCGWYLFAFVWLVALWGLILWTFLLFRQRSHPAGWTLVPYLAWVAFAGYLNFGIYLLNK